MNTENTITLDAVTQEEEKMRLDSFLAARLKETSRAQAQRFLEGGCVFLNGKEVYDCSAKVRAGEVYAVCVPAAAEAEPQAENIPLEVVYEDDDLIVVNKPAGMTVHPAAGNENGTLVNALLYHCRGSLSGIGGVKRPGIVHRIDKDTSGLLVAAKNDFAHNFLSEQFAEHSIERTYLAVVYGVPNPLCGRIEGNIGRSPSDRKKMALVKTGGKGAVTHYKTLKIFKRAAALVQCNLETGRTHQIRVHLSSIGNALIGDKLYVKNHKTALAAPQELKNYLLAFPRQALHAKSLGFVHPRTGKFLQFDSELPEDMLELADKLEKF